MKIFNSISQIALGVMLGILLAGVIGSGRIGQAGAYDDSDPPGGRSGMAVYIDNLTGVQYLGTITGGLTVRVNPEKENWWERTKEVIPAPSLDKERPTWGLLVAVARNAANWGLSSRLMEEKIKLEQKVRGLESDLRYEKRKQSAA